MRAGRSLINKCVRLDEGTAREVKGWAARALVHAALDDRSNARDQGLNPGGLTG